jgi:hypothetical protein
MAKRVITLTIHFNVEDDNVHKNNSLDCISMADYLCSVLSEQLKDNTAPGASHQITGHYETTNAVVHGDGRSVNANDDDMYNSSFLDEGGY